MTAVQPPWEAAAHTLTEQAVQAAEEGRWDTVGACYRRRAELFRMKDVPCRLARQLQMLDQTIQERLRIATMTVQQLMTETAAKRRCLERFGSESDIQATYAPQVNRLV